MIDVKFAAEQFTHAQSIDIIKPYGSGNINNTYLVSLMGDKKNRFILQSINKNVFSDPTKIMQNISTLLKHVKKSSFQNSSFMVPNILKTNKGEEFFLDRNNVFWRAMEFIDAISFEKIINLNHASSCGKALGNFHLLVNNLNPETLFDTLPGFHITPIYLKKYHEALSTFDIKQNNSDIKYCMNFVSLHEEFVNILEYAMNKNTLKPRPIHGDPKVSNILIDEKTGEAKSIIDLDTIKSGLIHYDIGDCLRSCCNTQGEETENLNCVTFDTEICKNLLSGYFEHAKKFLSTSDISYIFDSIRLISFELGLRFFTDHLQGNKYFKIKKDNHNLLRALVQFKLTLDITKKEKEIKKIISELK